MQELDKKYFSFLFQSSKDAAGSQVLHPDNSTANMDEGLMATTKDPLWFLSRQWQTGEFEAENGGSPASIYVEHTSTKPQNMLWEGGKRRFSSKAPIEEQVEKEEEGASSLWNSERMEYAFDLSSGNVKLSCEEHHARRFDWFSFDVKHKQDWTDVSEDKLTSARYTPTTLSFKGMPHARWWQFESADTFLEAGYDPEPNALSMILAEYVIIDANNWFMCPLTLDVGRLHAITTMRVVDGFGVTTELDAIDDDNCRLFSLTRNKGKKISALFLPNAGNNPLMGDAFENILVLRDEDANMVWAIEQSYYDVDSKMTVSRGGAADQSQESPDHNANLAEEVASLPSFDIRSSIASNWIPYIPIRYSNSMGSGEGGGEQVYFRRARLNNDSPSYKTAVISESWRLREEEVPRYGMRLQRLPKAAMGTDGALHFWNARRKDFGFRHPASQLQYDKILEAVDK